ncbi:DUF3375 domain-containing protein [Humibacter sp. BT305]|nr:DUF3375 domain-containing protein [Humibacter sp. BT305]
MSSLTAALSFQRLLADNVTLDLLRSDNLAFCAAVLSANFTVPGTRIAAEEFHERVEIELDALRDHFTLPQNAKAYCDGWRTAGYLIRRPAADTRGETYEISSGALVAVRLLDQIDAPQSSVTESRLVSMAAAIRQLAVDTDPDVTRRIEALQSRRSEIDLEIERLREGDVSVLDERRALERVTDVLMQAQDLPADFARVRARFEQLNHDLRRSILDSDETPGEVLDDVFRGVDLIQSSDEGRTFSAFSDLLRDPERASALDDDITAILDRDFATQMPTQTRRVLRGLVRDLTTGSRDIHSALTEFARALRRYVYSQEFQRDRVLRDSLQRALAAAVSASQRIRPYADVGENLELSSMRISSCGEVSFLDPSEYDTGTELLDAQSGSLDFAAVAAIARESEIDFAELIGNVNDAVADGDRVSVGGVLERRQATQGLASVVGLMSLAVQHGMPDPDAREFIGWIGSDGVRRSAEIDTYVFEEKIDA